MIDFRWAGRFGRSVGRQGRFWGGCGGFREVVLREKGSQGRRHSEQHPSHTLEFSYMSMYLSRKCLAFSLSPRDSGILVEGFSNEGRCHNMCGCILLIRLYW